ncbi:MAG: ATP-binding protein [Chloroflexota bacterium]
MTKCAACSPSPRSTASSSPTSPWRRPQLPSPDSRSSSYRHHEHAEIPATPDGAADLHATLRGFWNALDNLTPPAANGAWRIDFSTAIGEIVANCSRYAYDDPTGCTITIDLRYADDHVEALISDAGRPFTGDLRRPMPVHDEVGAVAEQGRGLAMANALLDQFTYERTSDQLHTWSLRIDLPPSA